MGADLVQTVGKIAQAAVDIANPNSTPGQQNKAGNDLKEGIMELVMPKLDDETLAKYVGKWSENVEKDLKEKEEQERLAKEEAQRRQNLGLAQKEPNLLTKQEEKQQEEKKGYSVTDYMEKADAVARAARSNGLENRSNEELLRERVLQDKERIS